MKRKRFAEAQHIRSLPEAEPLDKVWEGAASIIWPSRRCSAGAGSVEVWRELRPSICVRWSVRTRHESVGLGH
jgi:hypothetical protein